MKYNFVLLFQEHFSKDRSDIEEEVDHAEEGGYHEEDQADHFSRLVFVAQSSHISINPIECGGLET